MQLYLSLQLVVRKISYGIDLKFVYVSLYAVLCQQALVPADLFISLEK